LAALGHLHKDVSIHALILTQDSEPRQRAAAMVSNDASAASSFHASSLGAATALA